MDLKLLFSDQSLAALADIVAYIAQTNPVAATEMGRSLIDHTKILQSFPYIGAVVPKRPMFRKLYHTPYTIYYRVHESRRVVSSSLLAR